MNTENILEFTQKLYERAAEISGGDYEIYAVLGDSFSVKVTDGEIESYNVNDYIGVSFRVKYNGRMGYSSTTALDVDSIDGLINSAKENAEVIENSDEQFIYSGSDEYVFPKIYDPDLENITSEQKIALARAIEEETLKFGDGIVRTMGSCVVSESGMRIIKNSAGLDLKEKSNIICAYVIPIAAKGKVMNSGFGVRAGYSISDINVEDMVRQGCKEAVDFCGAESFEGGEVKTLIKAEAMCDMLQTFLSVFSSDNAQRGLSLLSGKENEKIATDCVCITDDALIDYGFGSRGFDSEGVASKTNVIVENGVLKTLLYNLKTAKKAGVESTGNAVKGSYSSPIGVSGTNFILKPSDLSLDGMVKKAENGIMITALEGLHAGANAATGDFSLSAKGYLIENGELTRAVTGITVTGNFYGLLKNIEAVGSDLFKNPFGAAVCSPSVLLRDKMSVTGEKA